MLVLTRKLEQQIQIGEGITVTVLSVKGNTVKLGIKAPSDVRVLRGELEPKTDDATARSTSPINPTARLVRITDEERMMFVNPSSNYASAERLRPNTTTERADDRNVDRPAERVMERLVDRSHDRLGERIGEMSTGIIRRSGESPLRSLIAARR